MNLFLFAHQDDEYGVFPLLEQLVGRRESIRVVYLTSGTLDGQRSERRNRESTDVLARIGIEETQIYFAGADSKFPDGKLYQYAKEAAAAVVAFLENGVAPTRIYAPAWEGGHQDHDAAHIIACYLASRFGCLETSRQFPLYHGMGLPGIFWHTFLPMPSNGAVESFPIDWRQRFRCLRYGLRYRSQWSTWLGLYPMYTLYLLTRGRQYLQPFSIARLRQPPHDGACLYERRGFCTQEQFRYHTEALVDEMYG